MSERKTVTVKVFDGEQYAGDWPSKNPLSRVVDVIAWFQAKLAAIPLEYRADALCDIDSASGYEGDHSGHIEITYSRPETDEEMAARLGTAADQKARREQQELATLRALQTKYPNAT